MAKVYKIGIKITYDEYKPRIFFEDKFVKTTVKYDWQTPIFANNEEEAIGKFKERYDWENYYLPFYYIDYGIIDKNIKYEVVCINDNFSYTMKELYKNMDSNEFLHYCRQELGLEQTINNIINKK